MKHLLTIAMILLASAAAKAENYNYLIFQNADGTETALTSSRLKIIFSNGYLIATSGASEATLDLTSLSSMAFSDGNTTGITSAYSTGNAIKAGKGYITVSSNAESHVSVFGANGAVIAKGTVSAGGEETFGSNLAPGLYIVNVNGKSTKIIVK